jgi:uroporphyrinogen III methyltransferase/synthase
MTRARKTAGTRGRITFVGSGPGDPGLLTMLGTQAIAAAGVVVADAAVPAQITALAGADATVRLAEAIPADTAKALLADARAGATVVRVIAGDPFADDDAVREVLAVAKTVVPFAVVPGVASGVGTATYAGVPAGSTRTEVDIRDASSVDYDALAHYASTLVAEVDAADVQLVAEQLVANGCKPDTAVTVSCNGTTTDQQTVTGQLGELELAAVGMTGRLVVTVGKAAALRE